MKTAESLGKGLCVLALSLALALSGCVSYSSTNETPQSEKTLYTQSNMWIYHNTIYSVNMSVEERLPVNTKVVIRSVGATNIRFQVIDGGTYTYRNQPEYSGKTPQEMVPILFGNTSVDLSVFTEKEREFITEYPEVLQIGISKDAMLVARGLPPIHRTPSLSLDRWQYWRTKWNSQAVYFENDISTEIQN